MIPKKTNVWLLLLLVTFLVGNASGYWVHNMRTRLEPPGAADLSLEPTADLRSSQGESLHAHISRQVNPPDGYHIDVTYGDIGPQLLAAGAIDFDAFVQVYQQAGAPLTSAQLAILTNPSSEQIVFNHQNAYFLLNLFWAFGLANENPILTEGPMMTQSQGKVESFASTAGWTIGAKPVLDLYASTPIVTLTSNQQDLLERVAEQVYRPCCNNPTHFPDCNHGMAMLGLLQLMASQGASENQLFEAARYANAYWYPNQSMAIAVFFKVAEGIDFSDLDPRQVVGPNLSSVTGFNNVYEWLATNNLLPEAPGGGNGCGV